MKEFKIIIDYSSKEHFIKAETKEQAEKIAYEKTIKENIIPDEFWVGDSEEVKEDER